METINISLFRLAAMYGVLFIPVVFLVYLRLPLLKTLGASFLRMTVQLFLVGFYLKWIFERNSLVLTTLWLIIMVLIANLSVLKATNLSRRLFFPATLLGMLLSLTFVLAYMLCIVILPDPWYEARYLIPLGGMILGNSQQSLIISLERYVTLLHKQKNEIYSSLCMGATRSEALLPYVREALQAALSPALTGIATIGLVSLPGMMTGQMLGGAFPLVAIKYQIVIMIAIFTAQFMTATLNLYICTPKLISTQGNMASPQ